MATQKQIDANRRNAQKSTGPQTEEGKERSRANAFTHGLTCMTVYKPIRHEDPAEYHQMRAELVESWQPADAKEFQFVELISSAYKRIQRAEAYEAALFTGAMEGAQQKRKKPVKVSKNDDLGCSVVIGDEQDKLSWDNLDRYRRNAWADYNRAVTQLTKMQKERREAPARELRQAEREERAEKRHEEYLRKTVAPVVRVSTTPVDAREMGSFCPAQNDGGAIVRNEPSEPRPGAETASTPGAGEHGDTPKAA